MKKLIALFLAAMMLLGLLTACDSKEEETPKEVTLAESVIYNENDIKITVTGMKKTNTEVKLLVDVQNSGKHNFILTASHFVINGITLDGGCFIGCNAGESISDSIHLYGHVLKNTGIETIATIRGMDCSITDSDSLSLLDTFTFDLTTSAGADFHQEIDKSGDVLLNAGGIKILSQTYTREYSGEAARLAIVNDSGKDIIVEAQEIKVNGSRVDGQLYETVYADSTCYSDLSLSSSALKESNIAFVQSVSMKLLIFDKKNLQLIMDPQEIAIAMK